MQNKENAANKKGDGCRSNFVNIKEKVSSMLSEWTDKFL
jgi:hypothetical protein